MKSAKMALTMGKIDAVTAVVYCEGSFGSIDGKTANGLVRHSGKYEILSVIDSGKAGQDAGEVLDGVPNGIPICENLADALVNAGSTPANFIYGIAPLSGMLSMEERHMLLKAMKHGMNLVCGLHEFLTEDAEFIAAAHEAGVSIRDVRKPREKKDLRTFSGRVSEVNCPRIAVLGTDCAIGKRTTATILAAALKERGINAVLIGTGQTAVIQGARYGLAMDAVPAQFCAGELEAVILKAEEEEAPDVILIEGQGALSHPAYSTSSFILRGSCPQGVILQHAPARKHLCDFPDTPMPTAASEIALIEMFSKTKVIGLTLNHEDMTDAEVSVAIGGYEKELGIPCTDALGGSTERLVEMVLEAFPELGENASD
ncbi:DUF1611 domain-containing protein [Luteolibacter sp. AS25]|uniref:DUF1611 domain-containing protein n=1 Tax=Luteolibacter sp. AS25 TaxID=3135776 RepID=UPI00398B841D